MTLNSTTISIIKRLLGGRNNKPLKAILKRIDVKDLSRIFTLLNDRETRLFIDALMSIDRASQVLTELPPPQLIAVLEKIEDPKLLTLLSFCPEDDAVYILSQKSVEAQQGLVSKLDPHRQTRLKQLLSYPTGSAGRDMETDVFALPMHMTAQQAIDRIRERNEEESIYYVYCVDENKILVGVVSLRQLVSASATTPLSQFMKKEVVSVSPETTADEVAKLVSHYDYISLPVTNEKHELIGLITVDNVLDLLQEQAAASLYATAGLQDDDRVYSSARLSIKYRMPWMILNLALAAVASTVVSLFENTMSQMIVLASLNNIVAGIGGNTAIQTLTVITRGLATGDFHFISYTKALTKEVLVAMTNGLVVGITGGLLVYFWKGNLIVGAILCIALILNSIMASVVASVVPIVLKRMDWDPASGSGVIITFVTDAFGFFSFLGIATLAFKYFGL